MITTERIEGFLDDGRVKTDMGVRRMAGNALYSTGQIVTVVGDLITGWRRKAGVVPSPMQLTEGILLLAGSLLSLRWFDGERWAREVSPPAEGYTPWFCVAKDADYYILWVTNGEGTTAYMEHNGEFTSFSFDTSTTYPNAIDAKINGRGGVEWVALHHSSFFNETATNTFDHVTVARFDYYTGVFVSRTVDRLPQVRAIIDGYKKEPGDYACTSSMRARVNAIEKTVQTQIVDYTESTQSYTQWNPPPDQQDTFSYFEPLDTLEYPPAINGVVDAMPWTESTSFSTRIELNGVDLWSGALTVSIDYSCPMYALHMKNADVNMYAYIGRYYYNGSHLVADAISSTGVGVGALNSVLLSEKRLNKRNYTFLQETWSESGVTYFKEASGGVHVSMGETELSDGEIPDYSREWQVGAATIVKRSFFVNGFLNVSFSVMFKGTTYAVNENFWSPIFGSDKDSAWCIDSNTGEYERYQAGETTTGAMIATANRTAEIYTGKK